MAERKWTGKTDGNRFMHESLIVIFRHIDVRVIYGIMAIVILFYMLFNHKGYKAQYNYFRNCYGQGAWTAFCNVYRNHYQFGQVILDRFAAYAGRKYHFIVPQEDNDLFYTYLRGDGVILTSSHIGNFELAGYAFTMPYGKKMHVLTYGGEADSVMENRAKMFMPNHIEIIPLRGDLSHIFQTNEALERGDVVVMPGDRILGSSRTIPCMFFGREAQFPAGPFITAAMREKDMLAMFVMKEKWNTYRVYIHRLQAGEGKHKEQAANLVKSFAAVLEETVRKYPTQWFQYYDFWA